MYSIKFDSKVEKIISKWKKSNPALFKKLNKVLDDIMEHPKTGIGHPEALVGGNDITWSRRITANNRIIYNIYENEVCVIVIDLEGHYGDK